jgi:amidase
LPATNTCLPLPFGAHELDGLGATVQDLFDHLAPIETFTALFNGTGHPTLSLPLNISRAGLPIGMQFVAGFGQEATLFRLAAAVEQTQPWGNRRPVLHVAAAVP